MIKSNIEQINLITYQPQNHWRLVFEDYISFHLHVTNIEIPFTKLDVENKSWGSKDYEGYTVPETMQITFKETTTFSSFDFFNNWMKRIFNFTTREFKILSNISTRYKNATLIFKNDVNKEGGINKQYQLINLSPLGFDEISLDEENGEPLEFTMNFSIENVRTI